MRIKCFFAVWVKGGCGCRMEMVPRKGETSSKRRDDERCSIGRSKRSRGTLGRFGHLLSNPPDYSFIRSGFVSLVYGSGTHCWVEHLVADRWTRLVEGFGYLSSVKDGLDLFGYLSFVSETRSGTGWRCRCGSGDGRLDRIDSLRNRSTGRRWIKQERGGPDHFKLRVESRCRMIQRGSSTSKDSKWRSRILYRSRRHTHWRLGRYVIEQHDG